jgi:hypothetical protein
VKIPAEAARSALFDLTRMGMERQVQDRAMVAVSHHRHTDRQGEHLIGS